MLYLEILMQFTPDNGRTLEDIDKYRRSEGKPLIAGASAASLQVLLDYQYIKETPPDNGIYYLTEEGVKRQERERLQQNY